MIRNAPLYCLASSLSVCWLATISQTLAQIVPDATLPVNSIVTPQGNTSIIEGGTRAGSNLFHSFQEFSVPTGGTAFFNNALDIQNVLTRVTGNSISNIDGLIRANGTANLFLLNPNGIIFGPNASLNIGGSFLATTASSLNFADGTQYSAINPQSTPIVTISVPLGLQFPGFPRNIINRSVATVPGVPQPVGLQVLPGRTLALVGGDVTLEGGQLTAPQGRIELGSVGSNSLVSLNPTANGWALGYNGVQNFGNIQLSQSSVTASGPGGGNIQVQGGRVTLTDGSRILADTLGEQNGGGIDIRAGQLILDKGAFVSTSTFGAGNAGNLSVIATESVDLTGTRSIGELLEKISPRLSLNLSDIRDGLFSVSLGSGASGNLTIQTGKLIAQNGSVVATSNFTGGLGGNLTVSGSESVQLSDSGLLTGTASGRAAGELTINTGYLKLQNGGLASTSTLGSPQSQGGNLTVNAQLIELTGVSANSFDLLGSGKAPISSGLYTLSAPLAGRAGDLTINTGRLVVQDGAVVSTTAGGGLRSGDLTVRAAESVELRGTGKLEILEEILNRTIDPSDLRSGLFTSAFRVIPGFGGEAGNLKIETGHLIVSNGGVVSSSSFGDGAGGNLTVTTPPSGLVELIGGRLLTGTIGSQAAGDLTINTGQLRLREGAVVATSTTSVTSPAGRGGNLIVNAPLVELTGLSPQKLDLPIFVELQQTATGAQLNPLGPQQIPSSLLTLTFGAGDAGKLEVNTSQLIVGDGAAISTSAFLNSSGSGGDLIIRAPGGLVKLTGQGTLGPILTEIAEGRFDPSNIRNGLFTSSFGFGKAGDLQIETEQLTVTNGALVSASTFIAGPGGNITVNAPLGKVELIDSGLLTGTVSPQAAGNLAINTRTLSVGDGAAVTTRSFGTGKAGDLTIRGAELVEVFGGTPDGKVFSTLAATSSGSGNSGNIDIQTQRLIARDGADVSVSVLGIENRGQSGNLTVNASESIELIGARTSSDSRNFSRSGLFAATEGTGNAGTLTINTPRLAVRDGARVSVSTRGSGIVDAQGQLVPGGQGGSLIVNASEVELSGKNEVARRLENEQIQTISAPSGLFALSGEVRPNPKIIPTNATGSGGNLQISTDSLIVRDGAEVSASASGSGTSGNLTITARFIRLDNRGVIKGETASASAGNITLRNLNTLQLLGGSQISTSAGGGQGDGGNITINTETLAVLENSRITANAFEGRGGNITIPTPVRFLAADSEITARSQRGIPGIVELSRPDIQSSQVLVDAPQNVLNPEQQVVLACAAERGQNQSQFIITGRGGLPPSPTEPLSSDAVRVTGETPRSQSENSPSAARVRQPNRRISVQLPQPATGWIVNAKGEVVLTANAPTFTPQSSSLPTVDCHAR